MSDTAAALASSRARMKQLLVHAGIKRIVLVDDDVDPPDAAAPAVAIAAGEKEIKLEGRPKRENGELEDAFVERIVEAWNASTEEQRRTVWWECAIRNPEDMGGLAWLGGLFQGQLVPCPPADWPKTSAELVANEKVDETLVIFDRDLGGDELEGDKLFREWLSEAGETARGVVLTTTAAGGTDPDDRRGLPDEATVAQTIATDTGISPARVIVATKDDLNDRGLRRVVDAMRVGLSAPSLIGFRDAVLAHAKKAHAEAAEEMCALGLRSLEDVVVRSSREEGAFEADTLMRVNDQLYRTKTRQAIATAAPELVRDISTARDYANAVKADASEASLRIARQFNRASHWEEIVNVNTPGLPPENGDCLQFDDGTVWIVVEQSCDMALRDKVDPLRLGRTIVTLPVVTEAPADSKASWPLPSPVGDGAGEQWVNLGGEAPLPLLVLDMCSFSPDGSSVLRRVTAAPSDVEDIPHDGNEAPVPEGGSDQRGEAEAPIVALTPGLAALRASALEHLDARVAVVGADKLHLTVGALPNGVTVSASDAEIRFSVRRVARLSRAYAEALLNAYHGYSSRAAHDHDLSRFGLRR